MIEMPEGTQPSEPDRNPPTLPSGVLLRPPVSLDDPKADTELDPEGAAEFVVLIRALRSEGSRL